MLLVGVVLVASGCTVAPQREPFSPRQPLEVEGLPLAAAGVLGQAGRGFQDTVARLTGRAPRYVEWARAFNDPDATPDDLRQAMLGLVRYDYGRRSPYTDVYAQFARQAPAPLVRATALRALNISRDPEHIPLYIERLNDEAAVVRLEAAKALANIPSEEAADPLLAVAMNNRETVDVRVAAVDALRHYDTPPVKRTLARLLDGEEFSVVWQARRTLVTLTGHDHGFSADAWRREIG